MFAFLVPRFLAIGLQLVMLALVARRIWFLATKREGVPEAYAGLPRALGYVGAGSFVLGFVVLVLSFALRAGSGVPGGLLLIPAALCVPWAFFLTEVRSWRGYRPPVSWREPSSTI